MDNQERATAARPRVKIDAGLKMLSKRCGALWVDRSFVCRGPASKRISSSQMRLTLPRKTRNRVTPQLPSSSAPQVLSASAPVCSFVSISAQPLKSPRALRSSSPLILRSSGLRVLRVSNPRSEIVHVLRTSSPQFPKPSNLQVIKSSGLQALSPRSASPQAIKS